MTDILKQKIKHLRLDGKSYKDIAAAMNLNENTVKTYCRRNGLTDKDITLMFSEKKNKCLYCGAKINQTPKQKPKKFCCDKCRFAWWNKNRELKNKKALYTIKCSGCGKEFTSYGNKKRKYCSHSCYIKARFCIENSADDKCTI